jgi:glycosyltransferase involved in cell wall biosynthesis
MATACAIVATDCGGTDVLAGAGIVIPQDGSEQQVVRRIAQAIDSLLDDQQLRGAWGRRARARVVERYTLDHVAAAHLRIWSDILS